MRVQLWLSSSNQWFAQYFFHRKFVFCRRHRRVLVFCVQFEMTVLWINVVRHYQHHKFAFTQWWVITVGRKSRNLAQHRDKRYQRPIKTQVWNEFFAAAGRKLLLSIRTIVFVHLWLFSVVVFLYCECWKHVIRCAEQFGCTEAGRAAETMGRLGYKSCIEHTKRSSQPTREVLIGLRVFGRLFVRRQRRYSAIGRERCRHRHR